MIQLWSRPEINNPSFYHYACLQELATAFQVRPLMAGHAEIVEGVHLLMAPCRWLFERQSWFRKLRGSKIIIEHDAYLNFMPDSPWHKGYTKFYRSCNFDLLIASGKETTLRLRDEGIPAVWVPKGCNREFCDVSNQFSGKIGYFGLPILEQEVGKRVHFYSSRHEMSDRLAKFPLIASTVDGFVSTVSGFSAGVQNDASMGEPMAKHFEASALGCAVIRDRQPELLDLGYVDHESVIFYDDWNEMYEMLHYYGKDRNRGILETIQRRGTEVARNHTWADRAARVFEIVKPYVRERIFV